LPRSRAPPGKRTEMQRRPSAELVPLLLGGVLFVVLLWPLAEGVRGAFFGAGNSATLGYVLRVFRNPIYVEGLENALFVAASSTALGAVLGVAAALLVNRFEFPGKRALSALVPLPLLVPPFVGAIGVKQLLGQSGALNALLVDLHVQSAAHPVDWLRRGRLAAVVVLTALHLYPIVYFYVSAALVNLNVEMEEAAHNLGCVGLRALRKITLPLIVPSLFAACAIAFIGALTEFGVPLVCDYPRITSVQIFYGLKDMDRNPSAHVLVMVVLIGSVVLYAGARALFRRRSRATAQRGMRRRRPRHAGPFVSAAAACFLGALVGLAALPNVGVVLAAFGRDWYGTVVPSGLTLDHFRAALGQEMVVTAIGNSLRYVVLSTLVDLALGITIAWYAVRARSPVTELLDSVAMIPLVVPGLVMAFGYLAISRAGRPLAFLNPVNDPTALLVVAYAVRRLPFVVRSAAAGFEQVDVALEDAAASLGAGRARILARVTLPLLAPHLLAAAIFVFALSMLEVSDSLILAQKQATYPITKAIYELFQLLGEGRQMAAALGVWAMLFLACAIVLGRSLVNRRVGEGTVHKF
jgi:iron(III) transport system permease protein